MAGKNEVAHNVPAMPEWMKAQQVPTQDAEALSGLNNKIPRISLRGRKFRLVVEGEEIQKPVDTLDAVILGVEPEKGRMIKTYYEKGYSSGDTEPPTCSSNDGVRPDAWIQNKQNPVCGTCPKNQFGSATSQKGKPAKACKDSKRLHVAVADDPNDLGLGVEGTVFSLGIPVTSLSALGDYGKFISKNGYPLSGIVTKLSLADTEFPQLEFSFGRFLEEGPGMIAIQRNIEKDWMNDRPSGPLLEDNSPSSNGRTMISQQPVGNLDDVNAQAAAASKSASVNNVVGDWESN